MSLLAQKISGCYRRVLIFLISILLLGIGTGAFLYNRVGGNEGLQYWMAGRALNNTEKFIQGNRPDGIPQDTIESQFLLVRNAIDSRQINLTRLYEVLNTYQQKFQSIGLSAEKTNPSTPEVQEFLSNLQMSILDEDK